MGLQAYFYLAESRKRRKMFLVIISLSLVWVSVSGTDITDRVFSKVDYEPVAFGDFNSDKMTDIFVLTDEQKTLTILMSHTEEPLLRDGHTCQFTNIGIKNVVPSDFDGDGAMDVMLISLSKQGLYGVHILWGSLNKLDCGTEEKPLIQLKGQPLVFDYNGDMISDLFGEDENGQGMIWLATKNRNFTKVDLPLPLSSELRLPSSHAFIDFNNDLVADLWITTKDHYEVWTKKSGNFTKTEIPLPEFETIGQTSFADINLDGSVEVLLPVCESSSCSDSKIYAHVDDQWIDLDVNFKDSQGRMWHFSSGKEKYMDTITLRVGDYNLDGYPDILATLVGPDGKPEVTLLENIPCEKCAHPRTFAAQWGRFHHWNASVMGTFFDFEEDGSLDVILVYQQSPEKYQVAAYKNSIEYDAMFVKVLVLTGRCYLDCPHSQVPYGTNLHGPAIAYTITTATGDLQKSRTTQLSQTAHLALQLPYSVFGLGRNWNFIDVLSVGMPQINDTKEQIGRFTQIIPNSQLIVIPYPLSDPSHWAYKLFITPGKAMLKTAGALIGTMLFVACIIFVLHYQEKKQDKKEKLQEAHKFHFDAM